MRKLPLSLLLVLLALFALAAPAQALTVPDLLAQPHSAGEEADEVEAGDEDETEAEDDSEECEIEDEEDVALCAEIAREEGEEAEARRCVIEDATATVSADPRNGTVRIAIRYQAFAPTAVAIEARLYGSKGRLRLGASRTRFRRAGTFHDSFGLGKRSMEKALAAREFAIDLRAINAPADCRLVLTAHRGDRRKKRWS